MFRLFSRVVVVCVFALSLSIATIPAAQAKPLDSGGKVSNVSRSWTDAAMEWLGSLLGVQMKSSTEASKTTTANGGRPGYTTNGGPCIDPWGNPRPCP